MRRAIINADDFGLSEGINKGIIEGFHAGVLTSASLLVNMPGFENAVRLAKENPDISLGLHINIFRGLPVMPAGKVKTLLNNRGSFLESIFKIIRRLYLKQIDLQELELECGAQIRRALDRGLKIDHLDSEKHIHLLGGVYPAVVRSMQKYAIDKVRNINEYPYLYSLGKQDCLFRPGSFLKASVLQLLSSSKKKINSEYSIKTADYSFGIFHTGRMTADKYMKLFSNLKEGVTEVICHPGYINGEWSAGPLSRQKYYINGARQAELSGLAGLKELSRQNKIDLINYREL